MKKISELLGILLGLFLMHCFFMAITSVIFSIGIVDAKEISKHIYTITCIADILTIILVHFILLGYDEQLLSKDNFKKIKLSEAINISLFGFGLSVVLLTLVGMLSKLFPSYTNTQNQLLSASNSVLQLVILILLIPIFEEIIFRYVIFGYLKENFNIVFAVIVQALAFALAHGNMLQGIYTFLLGIALALIYMYSESLVGNILLHMIFNLFGILILPKITINNPVMVYVIIVLAIICLVVSILKMIPKYEDALYK